RRAHHRGLGRESGRDVGRGRASAREERIQDSARQSVRAAHARGARRARVNSAIASSRIRAGLTAIACAAIAMLVVPPISGWPPTVRASAVLAPAIALALLPLRPWRWRASDWDALEAWQPSTRIVGSGALVVFLLLFWPVLTRFQSGDINAIDFTTYFDRPCLQTIHGRPMFVETAETLVRSYRSQFSVHAEWAMLPVCAVYAIHP